MINFIAQCNYSYYKNYTKQLGPTSEKKLGKLFSNDLLSSNVISFCTLTEILQLSKVSKRLNHVVKLEQDFKLRRSSNSPGIRDLLAKEFTRLCFSDLTASFLLTLTSEKDKSKKQQYKTTEAVKKVHRATFIVELRASNTFSFEELNILNALYRAKDVEIISKINSILTEQLSIAKSIDFEVKDSFVYQDLLNERTSRHMLGLDRNDEKLMETSITESPPQEFNNAKDFMRDYIFKQIKLQLSEHFKKSFFTLYLDKHEAMRFQKVLVSESEKQTPFFTDKLFNYLTDKEISFIFKEKLLFKKFNDFAFEFKKSLEDYI